MASKPVVAANAANALGIVIPPLQIQTMNITLVGDTSLIVHKWSEKAIKMMLAKMTKTAVGPRAAKNPEQEYLDSMYVLADGTYGFPSNGIKSCAVDAATFVSDCTKVMARGAFQIGDSFESAELSPIVGVPTPREDVCRVGQGTADIRYRGEFKEWSITFPCRFNRNILSAEQICNLFSQAGFSVGIGEWRSQRDGNHGLFHVA